MTRSIVTAFHKYMPFGGEYFEPILDFYLKQLRKYKDEYDQLYLLDSNWGIPESSDYIVIKVNEHLRYYDAYKSILPMIKEDLVLFMDNDIVVYREGVIRGTFLKLEPSLHNKDTYDVASIYDTIGEYTSEKLNGKSKFCLYFFATRKDLLMNFRGCEWGPVSWGETLSELTVRMLEAGVKPFEIEEDKSSIYFDGMKDPEIGKNLGYYHIRAGSVPACLLAWRDYQLETYWKYLREQPVREYLRQIAWFDYIGANKDWVISILNDLTSIKAPPIKDYNWINIWSKYMKEFKEYHRL